MSLISDRSQERLTDDDLARLSAIAAADRAARFARRPRWAIYRDRVICVALCPPAPQSVAQAVDAQSATIEDHRSAMGTKLGTKSHRRRPKRKQKARVNGPF
jgi:hypothetical protein